MHCHYSGSPVNVGTNLSSIIFVHGLGSNPDTTWQARRNTTTDGAPELSAGQKYDYVDWISDFLLDDLSALDTDIRVFYYNFDSYWKRDALHVRLSTLGTGLLEQIHGKIRSSEEVSIDYTQLSFGIIDIGVL